MRISIPIKAEPKTGKGFFCVRLAKALRKMGNEIVTENEPHQVSLHIVKMNNGKGKRVIRLDGVYHNVSMNYKSRNKEIARNLHAADAVVYQSKFSKRLCDKYLKKFKGPVGIIPNGADPEYYNTIKAKQTGFKYNILSASRWRPHKRLRDIIESFLLANIRDSCLYIAGELEDSGVPKIELRKYFRLKNVVNLGRMTQESLSEYLKASSCFIHLCWFDNCPNAVVEAMCAGVPVVSNNVGGTPEIVMPGGGIVCDIDSPYNLKPVKLYKPPKIKRDKVAEAICRAIQIDTVNSKHVNINEVASQYLRFFESL